MAQQKKRKSAKSPRRPFGPEYRAEALKLAESIGVTSAAKQLDIHTSQIYAWRIKAKTVQSQSAAEKALLAENAKLKRQLSERNEEVDILKKASAYFAKHQK